MLIQIQINVCNIKEHIFFTFSYAINILEQI